MIHVKEISVQEQYEYFVNTFNNIGTFLRSCSTEEIDYRIFEEFDGDCISFLNENILSNLLSKGLINDTIFHMSVELVMKVRDIESTSLCNSTSVKVHPYWLEILTMADRIRSLIVTHNK